MTLIVPPVPFLPWHCRQHAHRINKKQLQAEWADIILIFTFMYRSSLFCFILLETGFKPDSTNIVFHSWFDIFIRQTA